MTLRVALVGYGLGGSAFHAPFIHTTDGLSLAAIVTRNPQRQRTAAQCYPHAKILSSTDELWPTAAEFDLAVITTPNRYHVEHATMALRHGLHVVVDKPMAPTAAEARGLADLAAEQGLYLSPFHNRRYDGDFLTIQELLSKQKLGCLVRFESRFERWRPEISGSGIGWKKSKDPAAAGGIVYDLGSHLIDQAVVLFGRPTQVYAEITTRRPGAVADDDAFIALTHPYGVHSQLWMSAIAADVGPRFRVLGMDGAYVKHGMDPQEELLKQGALPGGADWGTEPEHVWGKLGTPAHHELVPTLAGNYHHYYRGIERTLTTGTPLPVNALDGITTVEVIEAAYQSGRAGQTVPLP